MLTDKRLFLMRTGKGGPRVVAGYTIQSAPRGHPALRLVANLLAHSMHY